MHFWSKNYKTLSYFRGNTIGMRIGNPIQILMHIFLIGLNKIELETAIFSSEHPTEALISLLHYNLGSEDYNKHPLVTVT